MLQIKTKVCLRLRRLCVRSSLVLSLLTIAMFSIYNLGSSLYMTRQPLRSIRHLIVSRLNTTYIADEHTLPTANILPRSYGEQRAQKLRSACAGELKRPFSISLLFNKNDSFLFCSMCKIASTFWRRFFGMLNNYEELDVRTPYDVAIPQAPKSNKRIVIDQRILIKQNAGSQLNQSTMIKQKAGFQLQLQSYKVVFVRDPYSRILASYIDKLFAPNPTFWKSISEKVIRRYKGMVERPTRDAHNDRQNCASDLTFHEYVHAIVQAHNKGSQVDCHDTEFLNNCHMCDFEYDFVGKLESFVDDSLFLIRKLGLNKTLEKLEDVDHFRSLADQDALEDTIRSPFGWKSNIKKCITWDNALRRVWRKLQIRGVIGKDEFPLSREESDRITVDEMVALVMKTQTRTPYKERKAQRKAAMIEIYRMVPMDLVHGLRKVYARDFSLLEYDASPSAIFDRNVTIAEFGYLAV